VLMRYWRLLVCGKEGVRIFLNYLSLIVSRFFGTTVSIL
jgi:hypothetical protein